MRKQKSRLDDFADKFLWKLLSILFSNEEFKKDMLKNVELNAESNPYNYYDWSSVAHKILKPLGIDFDERPINVDFLYELVKENYNKIVEEEFSGELIRPKLKKYIFDVAADVREYKTEYYRHEIYGYSRRAVEYIRYNENWYYSDGDFMSSDISDSDYTDIQIEDIEERPINENFNKDEKKYLDRLIIERNKIDQEIKKLLK